MGEHTNHFRHPGTDLDGTDLTGIGYIDVIRPENFDSAPS